MSRTAASMWLACSLLFAVSGCAHMDEQGAINKFTAALDAKKPDEAITGLKGASSKDFAELALRRDDAINDLKILHLPTEKPDIVSVKDISESEKLVVVESGPAKHKLEYRLIRDASTRKWVVDDIYMKQKKDGVTATRSVTEQMDLLLSVREFLHAWTGTDRKEILDVTTPSLRSTLDSLPPAYLAQLSHQVSAGISRDKAKPEAQLDDDVAVVKVQRKNGQLMLNLRLVKDHWLVSDLAVEAKGDDGIPSLQKHCIALDTSLSFLRAYGAEDRETLKVLCADKFYRSGLAPADLTSVPLPTGEIPVAGQQFRIIAKRAELIVPVENEKVKVSLVREEATDSKTAVRYRVEEVSLHSEDGGERRLSSMFTAHAMLSLFADALASRDLPTLRKTSTTDFNRRVWERLKQSGPPGTVPLASEGSHTTIDDLPLGEIPSVDLEVLETKYNGAVTEISVRQGLQELTYLLREHAGEVRVDDVLLSPIREPRSLKEITELVVPMREFIAGLAMGDLGLIQRTSSNDYNKLVWKQTDKVPQTANIALEHLSLPITGVKASPDEVMITLGDESWGARVLMAREYSKFVVDEVFVIRGIESAQRTRMKQAMRLELAGANHLNVGLAVRKPIVDPKVRGVGGKRYAHVPEDEGPSDAMMPPDPSDDAFVTPRDDEPGMLPEIDAMPVEEADAEDDGIPKFELDPGRAPNPPKPGGEIQLLSGEQEAELDLDEEPAPVRKPSKPVVIKPKRKPVTHQR